MFHVTKGKVKDINDPAKAGRIMCELSEFGGDYPDWINPVFPGMWFTIPDVGDTVFIIMPVMEEVIEFADEIYYLGVIRTQEQTLPKEEPGEFSGDAYPERRGLRTKSGHTFVFDDTTGVEEITISFKGVIDFIFTSDGIRIGTGDAGEPMVMGTLWQTLVDSFMTNFLNHTHSTGTGPSGPVLDPQKTNVENLQTNVNNGDHLSDFIFGQKVKPT
jgi:hypothetical protein